MMSRSAQELVEAAQEYDWDHRPPLSTWTRVPDEQVLRLLTGARLVDDTAEVNAQIRRSLAYLLDHYGTTPHVNFAQQ